MDEILSSIRQIIADDDAAAAPRRPAGQPASMAAALASMPNPAPSFQAAPMQAPSSAPRFQQPDEPEPRDLSPLALSPEQIVRHEEPASALEPPAVPEAGPSMAFEARPVHRPAMQAPDARMSDLRMPEPAMVDPEDISFEVEDEAEPEPEAVIEPTHFPQPSQPTQHRPSARISEAAPMPDRTLSRDLTEQLIEPATNAAVRHTFSRLNSLAIGTPGLTVEEMIRDMLRPMLKDWLDENLPAMVERMVEKEIARISRGVD